MHHRMILVTYQGETDSIPTFWLIGATHTARAYGATPLQAYHEAIAQWFEQKRFADQHATQTN